MDGFYNNITDEINFHDFICKRFVLRQNCLESLNKFMETMRLIDLLEGMSLKYLYAHVVVADIFEYLRQHYMHSLHEYQFH